MPYAKPLLFVLIAAALTVACKPSSPDVVELPVEAVDAKSPVSAAASAPVLSDAALSNAISSLLPADYRGYDIERLADGRYCAAGAAVSGDTLVQTPSVYGVSPDGRRVIWGRKIDIPAGHHQARATHCVDGGDRLFVLVQSDTQSSAALSQTFLRVVRLDAATGDIRSEHMLKPDTAGASYSAWVGDDGAFAMVDGHLKLKGQYFLLTDRDKHIGFDLTIAADAR